MTAAPPCRAAAVLVDGDNLPCDLAGPLITAARQALGPLAVLRVYGDSRRLNGWAEAPGFRLVHAHAGKNVTDMVLTIEAMELSYAGIIDGFAIATRDRDFAPLAWSLRARGLPVLGLSDTPAPDHLTRAFTWHVTLAPPAPAAAPPPVVALPAPAAAPPAPASAPPPNVASALRTALASGPQSLNTFAHAMKAQGVVKSKSQNWAGFLAPHAKAFVITGSGHAMQIGPRA